MILQLSGGHRFDLILEGAQNLVIPISEIGTKNSRKKLVQKTASNSNFHNNRQYCWLTQEDIIRYLLDIIPLAFSVFSPTPINPINSLNIIDSQNILAVHYDDPAYSALPFIANFSCYCRH